MSSSKVEARSIGLVQIASDLDRSKMRSQRELEERKFLLDKHAAKLAADQGQMQLESVIESVKESLPHIPNPPDNGGDAEDGDELSDLRQIEKQRIRSAQLDLMWQGKMHMQPAYDVDQSARKTQPQGSTNSSRKSSSSSISSSSYNVGHIRRAGQHLQAQTAKDSPLHMTRFSDVLPAPIYAKGAAGDASIESSLTLSSSSSIQPRRQQTGLPKQPEQQRPSRNKQKHQTSRGRSSGRRRPATKSHTYATFTSRSDDFGELEPFVMEHFPDDVTGPDSSYDNALTATGRYHDFDASQNR
jgi:hypothetical protein